MATQGGEVARGDSGNLRALSKARAERRAILRLAVRRQHELDRQVEQRAKPSNDVVTRHVLAAAELDVQSPAEVGEESPVTIALITAARGEIVVLAAFVGVDAKRPRSGPMEVSFAFAGAEPGEVVALHATDAIRIDAELLDPVLPCVCRRRVHRKAKPPRVALVVRRGQHDSGRALAQLVRNAERIEQQEIVANLDPVRRDELGPPPLVTPIGMGRLPMPDTGAQLAQGRDAMRLKPAPELRRASTPARGCGPPVRHEHNASRRAYLMARRKALALLASARRRPLVKPCRDACHGMEAGGAGLSIRSDRDAN